jgi:hypothetical protein
MQCRIFQRSGTLTLTVFTQADKNVILWSEFVPQLLCDAWQLKNFYACDVLSQPLQMPKFAPHDDYFRLNYVHHMTSHKRNRMIVVATELIRIVLFIIPNTEIP